MTLSLAIDKMVSWLICKLMKWQVDKMALLMKLQVDKMAWQANEMMKW